MGQEEHVEAWEHEPVGDWKSHFDEMMTLDPAVQIGGEEIQGLNQQIRDRLAAIPEEVKHEVRRAHHQLGHLGRIGLLRLARNAVEAPHVPETSSPSICGKSVRHGQARII